MRKRGKKRNRKRHFLVRVLRVILAFLVIVLVIAILTVALLPTVVSTERFRQFAEGKAAEALGRDLRIEQIDWSWRRGFRLSGLSVPDTPGFSDGDVVAIEEILLDISLRQLIKGRAIITLSVSGLTLDLVKNTNGTLNVETLVPASTGQQTGPAGAVTEEPSLPAKSLPIDMVVDADIRDLDLQFEDRTQNLRVIARGNVGTQFAIQGRTPQANELESLAKPPAFVDRLRVGFALDKIGVDMTLPDGSRISVDNISMPEPFQYVFIGRTGEGSLSCNLRISGIRELPGVTIADPLSVSAVLAGEHEWIDSISFSQELRIEPMGVSQTLDIAAYGLADALKYLPARPLHVLKAVGGTVEATLKLNETNDVAGLFPVAKVEGGIGLRCRAKLVPDKSVDVAVSASSPGIDLDIDSVASIKHFGADLALERTLALHFVDSRALPGTAEEVPLSRSVFDTAAGSSAIPTPGSGALSMQSGIADMHRMLALAHSLSVGSIRATAAPMPITISNLALDIDLEDNLPVIELLQFDLLGGTIAANAGLRRHAGRYHVDAGVQFSGINTGMIVEDPDRDASPESELTGSLEVSVPLDTNITAVIRDTKAVVNISHIGPRTLERLLYAIDPSGSDETIVAQRRLLRKGSPKWVRVGLQDGALSVQGEVTLLGAAIALPSLKRLNVSELSIVKQYGAEFGQLAPVITALDTVSAASISIQPDGRTITTR